MLTDENAPRLHAMCTSSKQTVACACSSQVSIRPLNIERFHKTRQRRDEPDKTEVLPPKRVSCIWGHGACSGCARITGSCAEDGPPASKSGLSEATLAGTLKEPIPLRHAPCQRESTWREKNQRNKIEAQPSGTSPDVVELAEPTGLQWHNAWLLQAAAKRIFQ